MNFEPHDTLAAPAVLQSAETEAVVLSILMNFPAAFDDMADRLKPEHFAVDSYRSIYAELCRQMAAGRGCDDMSIAQALEGVVAMEEVLTVARCHDHSARAISRHAQTLIDMHQARGLHALSYRMAELAFEDSPIADRIDRAQAEVAKLETHEAAEDWVDAHTAAIQHLDLIDARAEGKISGLPTGFHDLDELLDGGMARGNLVVVGARPAMGKTAFAMTLGLHMAATWAVGMFSMEMPHSDVRDRQAAILGRVSIADIKRPKRAGGGLDFSRIVDGVERSKALRWNVSDRSSLNILQVRSMARALKRRRGLDVLIVDYIGLMAGLDPKQNRAYQIEEISRGLKSLAKELDIVVVCLAQVNRGAAEKAMNPPSLHELRDSGAIEQDADVVAFIHRPIQANPDAGDQFRNYAQLRVAKNRQGRTGDVHLFYHGEFTGFEAWGGPIPTSTVTKTMPARRGMEAAERF
ncbi:MAG: AAA family ATPase [Acidovorax sp.]|nr:AAA family ATPase [Acidovorax sp.]